MFTTLIFGAGFLALSDVLAKHLLFPTEIPAGVITALLGVPFFLFLLRKHS
jgi:iron complex transport system permease protein